MRLIFICVGIKQPTFIDESEILKKCNMFSKIFLFDLFPVQTLVVFKLHNAHITLC